MTQCHVKTMGNALYSGSIVQYQVLCRFVDIKQAMLRIRKRYHKMSGTAYRRIQTWVAGPIHCGEHDVGLIGYAALQQLGKICMMQLEQCYQS